MTRPKAIRQHTLRFNAVVLSSVVTPAAIAASMWG
jgi:hypothetical protein